MLELKEWISLSLTNAMYVDTMKNSCHLPAIPIAHMVQSLKNLLNMFPWSSLVKLIFAHINKWWCK
jgi:hypothetical protein